MTMLHLNVKQESYTKQEVAVSSAVSVFMTARTGRLKLHICLTPILLPASSLSSPAPCDLSGVNTGEGKELV